MEDTRKYLLNRVIRWATNESEQKDEGNTFWIYGLPGIGKTSLAHSICASLHEQEQLAGAFFCRRDDPELSEARNILPTLIHKLAIIFPPFRSIVAERLRKDPNVTPDSMKYTFFLDLVRRISRLPQRTLIFVIDALDECGNPQSRPSILRALTDAATDAPWLKIIITSRPEADILHFFNSPTHSSHLRYDLTTDQETTSDLRIFARARFDTVALGQCIESPWPEQLLFDAVISRAAGLFIFVETIALALEHCDDPTGYLKGTLQDSAGTRLTSLYKLYSSILNARRVRNDADFQQMIGVLLAAAPHRALRDETIADLAGVRPNLVKMWVADLSSLLYRDEGANGGIRVRHLSISDFFLNNECHNDYHIDIGAANTHLGTACLKTMVEQLRFNICKLEDSRLANADVHDLPSRIKENMSDTLQYSSVYWSNHVCFDPGNRDWESLNTFFEGPYALFWIEVLSIMGMVPIGVPSLRRVRSAVVKVSEALSPAICFDLTLNLLWYRMSLQLLLIELRKFVVSLTLSAPRSLRVLHIHISQRDHSCRLNHIYQRLCSAHGLIMGWR